MRWATGLIESDGRGDHKKRPNRNPSLEADNRGRSQLYIRCLGAMSPKPVLAIVDRRDRSGRWVRRSWASWSVVRPWHRLLVAYSTAALVSYVCLASHVPSATGGCTHGWIWRRRPELGYASRGPTAGVPNMASQMPL